MSFRHPKVVDRSEFALGNRKRETIEEKDQNEIGTIKRRNCAQSPPRGIPGALSYVSPFPPRSALIVDERVKNLMRGGGRKGGRGEGEAITKKTAWSRPEQDLGLLMALFRLPKARASRWGMAASARGRNWSSLAARVEETFFSLSLFRLPTVFFFYNTTRELSFAL